MKKNSSSLITKKMQIKMTVRIEYTRRSEEYKILAGMWRHELLERM